MYPFNIYILIYWSIKMLYTYKEKLDGAETKTNSFENDISTKDNIINELKIKNYDLLTKVTVGVPQEEPKQEEPKIISINDLI